MKGKKLLVLLDMTTLRCYNFMSFWIFSCSCSGLFGWPRALASRGIFLPKVAQNQPHFTYDLSFCRRPDSQSYVSYQFFCVAQQKTDPQCTDLE